MSQNCYGSPIFSNFISVNTYGTQEKRSPGEEGDT